MSEATDVRVLTIGPAPSGPRSRGGMASVMALLDDHPDPAIDVRIVSTFVDDAAARRIAVGLWGMAVSTVLVLTGRVDVLHVHLAHGGSVVRKSVPLVAARLRGVASVVHAHSYDFAGWFDRLPRPVRAAVRQALRADRWIVLAEPIVEELQPRLGYPREQFRVLHNPAVAAAPRPEAAAGDGRVVAVALGRLGHRKGSFDVVEAAAKLPDAVRERLRIVLAGDGQIDEVRRAVVDARVQDTVEVRGWLGPEERDALLGDAQVLVLPSYEEGLPMALLESMAAGLAPLVTPVGGIGSVVTDEVDGLLVEPGNVGMIGEAMTRLVEDPALLARLAAAARARAQEFGVERWYADLADLWRDVA